jgi:hypothetical protein
MEAWLLLMDVPLVLLFVFFAICPWRFVAFRRNYPKERYWDRRRLFLQYSVQGFVDILAAFLALILLVSWRSRRIREILRRFFIQVRTLFFVSFLELKFRKNGNFHRRDVFSEFSDLIEDLPFLPPALLIGLSVYRLKGFLKKIETVNPVDFPFFSKLNFFLADGRSKESSNGDFEGSWKSSAGCDWAHSVLVCRGDCVSTSIVRA